MTIPTNAPPLAQAANLDLLRFDVLIRLGLLHRNVEVALIYVEREIDPEIENAIENVRKSAMSVMALARKFLQSKSDAALSIEANTEWRAERDGRRA